MSVKLSKLSVLILMGALGITPSASFCSSRKGQSDKTLYRSGSKLLPSVKALAEDPALKLVNKKESLGRYKPLDIVEFDGIMVSKRIIPDLKKLLETARSEGLTLKVVSGYRSYERQITVFNSWVNRECKKNPSLTREEAEKIVDHYSARPGHSEHQLGTTVDILSAENGYKFSSDRKWKFVAWLERNAGRFNFKISYGPDHKEYQYEPWHLRWYPTKASDN